MQDERSQQVGSDRQAISTERDEAHDVVQNLPCLACNASHLIGYCPLKQAGVEFCGLCGLAHYGSSGYLRNCPHLNSVTQCRAMLETLKSSTDSRETIDHAKKYIIGVIGGLNRKKKVKESKALRPHGNLQSPGPPSRNQARGPPDTGIEKPYSHPYMNDVQMNENSTK
jgi:chromodomain-helicase-DNA-binding protein 4